MDEPRPTEQELLVLLAVVHAGEEAYGVSILDEIRRRSGRGILRPAVYATLRRLEDKGLVDSSLGDPLPERGGRARRYYSVTDLGRRALEVARREWERMWNGVGARIDTV